MPFKNYRDISRVNYGREYPEGTGATMEDIRTGALLRIADASEKMAKNITELQSEHERLQERFANRGLYLHSVVRSNRALRGQITKLKKRLSK